MQEGSLRVDANINLHIATADGQVATPIVEVKNMNSFRAVERALAYEAERQCDEWQATGQTLGEVPKQTRGWDDQAQVTRAQRHKEESSDYRYFPDPDLVPVIVSAEQVEEQRRQMGELPAACRQRLQDDDGYLRLRRRRDRESRPAVRGDYFEQLVDATGDAKRSSNWIQQDVLRVLKERSIDIGQFPLPAVTLGQLLEPWRPANSTPRVPRTCFNGWSTTAKLPQSP